MSELRDLDSDVLDLKDAHKQRNNKVKFPWQEEFETKRLFPVRVETPNEPFHITQICYPGGLFRQFGPGTPAALPEYYKSHKPARRGG